MKNVQLGLFLVLCLVSFKKGICLLCYECTEVINPDCAKRIKHIQTTPCKQASDVCVVHITPAAVLNVEEYSANMSMRVIRGCKFRDYCEYVKGFSVYCSTCFTDMCNFGSVILRSNILVLFCIFISKLI